MVVVTEWTPGIGQRRRQVRWNANFCRFSYVCISCCERVVGPFGSDIPIPQCHSLCTLKMSPFRIKDVCDWEDVMTSVWILRGRPGHGQQRTDACGRGKDDSGQMLVEMGICLKIQGERKKL